MALKLMYITNLPEVATIAEAAGVDRIFVDLEYIGKALRQGGMDTVQSKHTLDDVRRVSEVLGSAELLVRINPIHEATEEYCSSQEEIDTAIENGADLLMLPYFKTEEEVRTFVSLVRGRVRTMLLVETPEAVACLDEILAVDGVDEVFIGLNDLSLGYGKKFMFELLADGTVERIVEKIKEKGLPYGFGGLASPENGAVPGKFVISEHYRLGSGCVILSRSFCHLGRISDLSQIRTIFMDGVAQIRSCEEKSREMSEEEREEQRTMVRRAVDDTLEAIAKRS